MIELARKVVRGEVLTAAIEALGYSRVELLDNGAALLVVATRPDGQPADARDRAAIAAVVTAHVPVWE